MILIGPALEQALSAIRCCCDIPIDWAIVDQIERDSQDNQVDSKHYVLHDSRRACLTAIVDAYEPDTVRLCLARGRCQQFGSIISSAAEPGFAVHGFFFERPQTPPRFLADVIQSAHAAIEKAHAVLRIQFIATRRLDAVTRCFLNGTGIMPTPYVVYSTNVRTMETRKLMGDDA